MNAHQIVQAAMPDATPGDAEYILWARTSFPLVPVSARQLYREADRVRRAIEHGLRLCEFCDRIARPGADTCEGCDQALRGATNRQGETV